MKKTILILLLLLSTTALATMTPKSLLIYYGYPSLINECENDINCAAKQFQSYDYIVLGDGLEQQNHPDHENTKAIIQTIHENNPDTKIFGYLSLVSFSHQPHDVQITLCDDWKKMGVQGVIFDEFGYDFGVTRDEQNNAIDIAHQNNLAVIANGWNLNDIFGTQQNEAPTKLTSGDYYISESYQYMAENGFEYYVLASRWREKADLLQKYLSMPQFAGIKVLATTTSLTNEAAETKLEYAWYSALLDGDEAIGWGTPWFSATGADQDKAPYYARPTLANPGKKFLGNTEKDQTNPAIYYRKTDTGKIIIDTEKHVAKFEKN